MDAENNEEESNTKAAPQTPERVKRGTLSEEDSSEKARKISISGVEQLLQQFEEQAKEREENERRLLEKVQSLLKPTAAPKQSVVDTKASNLSIKASFYTREENEAKQIMEQRLLVLKKTPVYGAALIDEFRYALKVYATECQKAQVAESDYDAFRDKLLNECLETAHKCGMTLDTSNILLPTLRSPFSDPNAMDLKAMIKKGPPMWRNTNVKKSYDAKWCEEPFKQQFNLRLEQSFKEVVFVNELTVKRLIENSRALRDFFLNFADHNDKQLMSQGLQLINECIAKQWRTLFQTKPLNPVFFEEMLLYLQMVERELNVQMDPAISNSFSIYPRKKSLTTICGILTIVSKPIILKQSYITTSLPALAGEVVKCLYFDC